MGHRTVKHFTGAVALFAASTMPVFAQGEVTLYTTREAGLVQPLLTAFTATTGTKVNTVFVKDGLLERVKAEGARSPADVLMTVDIGNLMDLVEGGVTQPVASPALNSAIPANLRGADGQWFFGGTHYYLSTGNWISAAAARLPRRCVSPVASSNCASPIT